MLHVPTWKREPPSYRPAYASRLGEVSWAPASPGFASVRASPGISPRSLQVSDLLLLIAEWAGYSVSTTAGPATLVVEGERVPFSIVEEIGRTLPCQAAGSAVQSEQSVDDSHFGANQFVQSDGTLGRLAQRMAFCRRLEFSKGRLIFSEPPGDCIQSVA